MRIITNNFQKNQFFFTDCGWRGGGGVWRFWGRSTSYIMVFRGYRGGGEGQSTPTEYKEGTIRIDFLLTAKEGGLREYIYVIYQTGGPYWEKLCTRSWIPAS